MLSEEPNNTEEKSAEEPKRKTRKNLPKHVTSTLKAWIISHKHHPYPEDKDKVKFAREFNLTVTQINNWFINNRRRFFKKECPANAKANVFKRKKASSGSSQKKRRYSENDAHSSFSSPGTSMSHEDCQNSNTSESSLQESAPVYSSPYVDLSQIIHNILQSQYPFSSQLAFLAAVTLVRDNIEKLSFMGRNERGSM